VTERARRVADDTLAPSNAEDSGHVNRLYITVYCTNTSRVRGDWVASKKNAWRVCAHDGLSSFYNGSNPGMIFNLRIG
jgi:hypothetical protein